MDRTPCTCTANHQPCPACRAYTAEQRWPHVEVPKAGCGCHCTQHRGFTAGCVDCQAVNRAYCAERRQIRRQTLEERARKG